MHRSLVLLFVSLLVLLPVAPAFAEDRAAAERFFRLGEKAYQTQNFKAAAMHFEEAYKRFALPEIAFSAAQAYRRLYRIEPKPEDVQRAVDLYRAYLAERKTGGRVADAADALAEMQHELEKLIASGVKVSPALAAQHTRIVINASLGKDAGATNMQEVEDREGGATAKIVALLDGKPVDVYAPLNVMPGKHEIQVTAAGYFDAAKSVNAQQGTTFIADIELVPRPAKVTLKTEPGARISVDGRPAGTAPLAAIELPAGKHVITILHRGREAVAREVVVARGQDIALDQPLRMTRRRKAIPWLLVGAGVATVATGIGITGAVLRDNEASKLLTDIRTLGNYDESIKREYDEARQWRDRWRFMAYTGGVMAIGLTGIAALLYYTDNPSPDGVRVEPLATSGGAGAAIAGRF